jgi:hypothetical protein
MTEVLYNELNPFEGIAPTPLVGREEVPLFYKDRYCMVERFILDGYITGTCQTFEEMVNRKRAIISGFSQSFKKFEIEEDLNTIYLAPVAKVMSVNFGDSTLMSLIPFTVELECYTSGFHSGFFGVIDPSNEFSFQEEDDKTVSFVHTSSARGVHTETADALTNAKNYVHSISGWSSQVDPLFISGVNDSLTLKTVTERIDRFSASYSLSEIYKYDSQDDTSGILRYTVEVNSGSSEPTEVVINGTIEGGHNIPMTALHQRFSGVNFFTLAGTEYSGLSTGVLNPAPLRFSFDDDSFKRNISFSVSYNDDPYPNPYLIDRVSIRKTKTGRNSISIDGRVKWRGNCLCNNEYGITQVKNLINTYDFYAHAVRKWEQYGMPGTLNPNPTSKSYSENKSACEYAVGLEFEEQPSNVPSDLENFDYTLTVKPAVPQYSATPTICAGQYVITRLKYNSRAKYTINGSATIKECVDTDIGLAIVRAEINRLCGVYVVGTRKVLESFQITERNAENPKVVNFTATWSAESPRMFNIIYDSD